MNVRLAKKGDVQSILDVAKAAWEADYPEILSENAEKGAEEWYNPDQIKTELENDDTILMVADDDGEVVGFAHAVWGASPTTGQTRQVGYILRVYVSPDSRQEGIGGDLLSSIRDSLIQRGADKIQGTVLAENEAGNAFYQKFGFEKVDEGETTISENTYTENVYERKR